MTDIHTITGAVFDEEKRFRYALWRKWKVRGKNIMFIGLNPSRANEHFNDPTITRLISFAKDLGYDGMYMANLFAYRDPNPAFINHIGALNLYEFAGPLNDEWIRLMATDSVQIVFCWGSWKNIEIRSKPIEHEFPNAMCFGKNKNGAPKHPLYLKRTTKLEKFR